MDIFGLHCGEPGAGQDMRWAGGDTRLYVKAVGHDPNDMSGDDFDWPGRTVVRIQHGWNGGGCIPLPDLYDDFAQRVANYVHNSTGIDVVVIGNEPNHSQEWPGGWPITALSFASCFRKCYRAIKKVSDVEVAVGAIAPYNGESGDWVDYFVDVIYDLENEYDSAAIHAYTRSMDPESITDPAKMGGSDEHYSGFLVYQEWLRYFNKDVYLTEFNVIPVWTNENTGVIQAMYDEVNRWNEENDIKIRCALVYRTAFDKWAIIGRTKLIEDYQSAVAKGYTIGDNMQVVFSTEFNEDFHDQGATEVTVVDGSYVTWLEDKSNDAWLARPELDRKDEGKGHTEFHSAPYAQSCFTMFSTLEAGQVFPVKVRPGSEVQASVWAMGVGTGNGLGMRIGIATEDPGKGVVEVDASSTGGKATKDLENKAMWGSWYSAYQDEYEERSWTQLWTPVVEAPDDTVWIVLNTRKDVAAPGHAHWDDLVVESSETPPTPPPPSEGLSVDLAINGETVFRKEYRVQLVEV